MHVYARLLRVIDVTMTSPHERAKPPDAATRREQLSMIRAYRTLNIGFYLFSPDPPSGGRGVLVGYLRYLVCIRSSLLQGC